LETNETSFGIKRKCAFWGLVAVFVVYSYSIYTAGTDMKNTPAPSESVLKGQQLYRDNNCTACHQFYGLGGYMGPDLTNVISDPMRGTDYARGFIEYGTLKMPNFELSEKEINDLIAYLTHVDASGSYKPSTSKKNWNGTVDYDRQKPE